MSRRDKLVPIAEFSDREAAEVAWARLAEAGIPANIESDPGPFGGRRLVRVYVARSRSDEGQRLIADLVR
ncbi:MAG TPA: SPOR domain-containing protein [Acidimicrobiia bacterium]|jgi:hypothetical protein